MRSVSTISHKAPNLPISSIYNCIWFNSSSISCQIIYYLQIIRFVLYSSSFHLILGIVLSLLVQYASGSRDVAVALCDGVNYVRLDVVKDGYLSAMA